MSNVLSLTHAVTMVISLRLRQPAGKLSSCVVQVKKLLKMCPDVWMQYKIAQDLGLQDVVKELLRNDSSSSYIQDLLSTQ